MASFPSAPIPHLNNTTGLVPVASVVGGATVVNGLAYMRGARLDYDAWAELGAPGWAWNDLLPYFKKSTTYTPPSAEVVREWNVTWDPTVYDKGPLQVTLPDFQYQDLKPFWEAWRHVPGVQRKRDIGAGEGPGVYWINSSIDRRNQTRDTSRSAYYDPVASRPNLRLLTLHRATEILFSERGPLTATGVKVTSVKSNETFSISARKEVILSAGSVLSVHLLQLSGLGPKAVLEAAGIKVKKDIPGIGANLQDHATITMTFNLSNQAFPNPDTITSNATYNATVFAEYFANKTGPIAAGSASLGAGLALPQFAPTS